MSIPTGFMVESPDTDWFAPVVFGGIQPTLDQLSGQADGCRSIAEQFIRRPLLLLKLALREQGKAGYCPAQALEYLNSRSPEGENLRSHFSAAITGQGHLGPLGWHAVLVASGVPRSIAAQVMQRRLHLRL